MCKNVQDFKPKLIKLGSENFYKHSPYLRKLRNRVHIHSLEDDADTDYLKFSKKDFFKIKKILLNLLLSDLFLEPKESLFDDLKISGETKI